MVNTAVQEKLCSICKQIKSTIEFGFTSWKTRVNGERYRNLDGRCRSCRTRYASALRMEPRNKEVYRAKKARYYQKHKKHVDAKNSEWNAANPDKRRATVLASEHKRRELGWRKRSGPVKAAIASALESYRIGNEYLDVYSGMLISKPSIDHVCPLSMGGTNDVDNLAVTTRSTNSRKHKDLLIVWLAKRAKGEINGNR